MILNYFLVIHSIRENKNVQNHYYARDSYKANISDNILVMQAVDIIMFKQREKEREGRRKKKRSEKLGMKNVSRRQPY